MAGDGQEAIELLESGSSAHILVTELALPGVDGKQLYEWVSQERPDLARHTVFVTTAATAHHYESFLGSLPNGVLLKPVTTSDLVTALNQLVDGDPISEAAPSPV